jgi:cell division protein FtsI/penicillin-binding protein 2
VKQFLQTRVLPLVQRGMVQVLHFNWRLLLQVSAILLVLVLSVFAWRSAQLHEQASIQDEEQETSVCSQEEKLATPEDCAHRSRTEAHDLFDRLMSHTDLVKPKPDGSLELPPSDYVLFREVNNLPIDHDIKTLLDKRLYGSIAGKAVQQQVAWWNHSRRFAAVRDDLQAPQGKVESSWVARDFWEGVLTGHKDVPLDFGYANAGRLPQHFNDWLSVSGQEQVVFLREITATKQTVVNLQVIGQPDITGLPGRVVMEACKRDSTSGKAHCEKVDSVTPDAEVYRLQLTLAGGASHKLKLVVKPASNSEIKVDGLPIHLKEKQKAGAEYQNSDFAWQPIYEYGRTGQAVVASEREQFRFKLKMADGTLLFDSLDNHPAKFAQDNGLLSLVGYDQGDRLALAGMVSRAKLPQDNTDVLLTLNSDMQRLAHKHLQDELKQVDPAGRFAEERRAAVVLMNPVTGEILAAANDPIPPANIHRWDRLSFSKLYPNRDPFGVAAWQGLDNNNTPGSVFKMVTALAGLQAAEEGRSDLRRMLRGLDSGEFTSFTGMKLSDNSYQPDPNPEITSKVSNAEGATLGLSLPYRDKNGVLVRPALRAAGCPASNPNVSSNLGLRESVRDSLNIWFSRFGVMMDGDNLASGGGDTQLVRMARQLGFGEKIPLAPIGSPLNADGKLIQRKGRGSVLNADAGSLTLESESKGMYAAGSALQRLSQNSFGQGVSTTPLQIARVASTVATGYLPQPYLLKSWAGQEQDMPEVVPLEPDDIDLLRDGMKAVPEVGTAAAAFNKYYREGRCQVYGKTGTAQVSKGVGENEKRHGYNSAWFAGWHVNANGKPDLAFACMVTHTYLQNHNYGGDVCGPIIARVLRDLDKGASQKEGS